MEHAIRDAQVYDDNIGKPTHAFAQVKNNVSNNANSKRKTPYAQGHKGDTNKKSKGTKGPLSRDELAQATMFYLLGESPTQRLPTCLKG